jgi:hypothetical protein
MTWYLEAMALAFWLVIGVAALVAVVVFVIDRSQKADAIRRNYPVIGRFRGLFSTLGEFFRQYFFAMDREELPFNRAQREWVKHASEGGSNTLPFGSTRNISVVGTPIFTPARSRRWMTSSHRPSRWRSGHTRAYPIMRGRSSTSRA